MTLSRALTERGVRRVNIDSILEPNHRDEDVPHLREETWLLKHVDRRQAESLLEGKCNETFLIRPGAQSPFVLSIM